MFNTDRGLRRKRDFVHAIRKKKISDHDVRIWSGKCWAGYVIRSSLYDNLHQYSKNKIHCSCWMCQSRSGENNSTKNYRACDRRKLDRVRSELIEELS